MTADRAGDCRLRNHGRAASEGSLDPVVTTDPRGFPTSLCKFAYPVVGTGIALCHLFWLLVQWMTARPTPAVVPRLAVSTPPYFPLAALFCAAPSFAPQPYTVADGPCARPPAAGRLRVGPEWKALPRTIEIGTISLIVHICGRLDLWKARGISEKGLVVLLISSALRATRRQTLPSQRLATSGAGQPCQPPNQLPRMTSRTPIAKEIRNTAPALNALPRWKLTKSDMASANRRGTGNWLDVLAQLRHTKAKRRYTKMDQATRQTSHASTDSPAISSPNMFTAAHVAPLRVRVIIRAPAVTHFALAGR